MGTVLYFFWFSPIAPDFIDIEAIMGVSERAQAVSGISMQYISDRGPQMISGIPLQFISDDSVQGVK